jgi:hypothetical protein
VDDYFYFAASGRRSYPWPSRSRAVVRFAVSTLIVVPLLIDVVRGMRRKRDSAWFFHVAAAWITLWVYAIGTIRGKLRPRLLDRTGWRQ